jgi:nucleoid-associated protein YgaU
MTADAKIGLLLGLVFIVIIAFLVNGLPNMIDNSKADMLSKHVEFDVPGESLVLTDRIRNAVDQPNGPEGLRRVDRPTIDRVVYLPNGKAIKDVEIDNLVLEVKESNEQVDVVNASRTYVVQSGDNLGKIAGKVYGSFRGNKTDVVEKLFKANAGTLSSPNDVKAGQKLSIPDLFSEVAKGPGLVTIKNPAPDLLKRVSPPDEKKKAVYATYRVQQYDSLWDIADEKLGNGNRFREIIELNKGRIPNPDDIKPGTELLLPAR